MTDKENEDDFYDFNGFNSTQEDSGNYKADGVFQNNFSEQVLNISLSNVTNEDLKHTQNIIDFHGAFIQTNPEKITKISTQSTEIEEEIEEHIEKNDELKKNFNYEKFYSTKFKSDYKKMDEVLWKLVQTYSWTDEFFTDYHQNPEGLFWAVKDYLDRLNWNHVTSKRGEFKKIFNWNQNPSQITIVLRWLLEEYCDSSLFRDSILYSHANKTTKIDLLKNKDKYKKLILKPQKVKKSKTDNSWLDIEI